MNKRQLVDRMSSGSALTMKQSEKALNGLMDVIHSELSSGGNVSLIGFGVFSVADRKARMARNPKTGEEMAANTTGGLEFVLNLKDNTGTDKEVTITPKVPAGGLEAGKSYLYTLLYSETAKDFITLSAEVVDWVDAIGGDLPVTPPSE